MTDFEPSAAAGGAGRRALVSDPTGVTGLSPHFLFDGVARAAPEYYAEVFGSAAQLHTFADLGRDDAPQVPLPTRAWQASDGQVTDRFGVRWLIGYLAEAPPIV